MIVPLMTDVRRRRAAVPSVVTVTPDLAAVSAGDTITYTITWTGSPATRTVYRTFGDLSPTTSATMTSGGTVAHVYSAAGSYTFEGRLDTVDGPLGTAGVTVANVAPALPSLSTATALRLHPHPALCWADDAMTEPAVEGGKVAAVELVDAAGAGTGLYATQTDAAARPTLVFVAGRWQMRFDAAQWLDLPAALVTGLTAAEAFLASYQWEDIPGAESRQGLWSFSSSSLTTCHPFSDGGIYEGFGTDTRKTCGNPTPSLAARRVYGVATSAAEYTVRIDGATLFTTGTNTAGWDAAPAIGRSTNGSGFYTYYRGLVDELLVFAGVLSGGDRTLVAGYLNRLISGRLGASRVLQDKVVLGATPAQGGTGTRVLTLYRGGVSLGTVAENEEWVDSTVAASTAYTYRLDTTDDTGTVSSAAAVTTPAASVRPTYPAPGGSLTAYLTGSMPLDVDGTAAELRQGGAVYDHDSGLYWAVGVDMHVSEDDVLAYYSSDFLNWKRYGIAVDISGLPVAGSPKVERPKVHPHPTTGDWWLFGNLSAGANSGIALCRSTTGPGGPYTYVKTLQFFTDASGSGDVGTFVDHDGRLYLYGHPLTTGDTAARMEADWQDFDVMAVSASGLFPGGEGWAPFRRGSQYHCFASELTVWAPNAGQCRSGVDPLFLTVNRTGATVRTTPGTAYTPDTAPYPGTTGGDNPYESDTNYGIHPLLSYNSQSSNVTRLQSGTYVLQADRWIGAGTPDSSLVWLPVTFDGSGYPTLAFAQTWTP